MDSETRTEVKSNTRGKTVPVRTSDRNTLANISLTCLVSDRLRQFLPQLKEANDQLEQNTLSLEDVEDDEEYVEMVSSYVATRFNVLEPGIRCA